MRSLHALAVALLAIDVDAVDTLAEWVNCGNVARMHATDSRAIPKPNFRKIQKFKLWKRLRTA